MEDSQEYNQVLQAITKHGGRQLTRLSTRVKITEYTDRSEKQCGEKDIGRTRGEAVRGSGRTGRGIAGTVSRQKTTHTQHTGQRGDTDS